MLDPAWGSSLRSEALSELDRGRVLTLDVKHERSEGELRDDGRHHRPYGGLGEALSSCVRNEPIADLAGRLLVATNGIAANRSQRGDQVGERLRDRPPDRHPAGILRVGRRLGDLPPYPSAHIERHRRPAPHMFVAHHHANVTTILEAPAP